MDSITQYFLRPTRRGYFAAANYTFDISELYLRWFCRRRLYHPPRQWRHRHRNCRRSLRFNQLITHHSSDGHLHLRAPHEQFHFQSEYRPCHSPYPQRRPHCNREIRVIFSKCMSRLNRMSISPVPKPLLMSKIQPVFPYKTPSSSPVSSMPPTASPNLASAPSSSPTPTITSSAPSPSRKAR